MKVRECAIRQEFTDLIHEQMNVDKAFRLEIERLKDYGIYETTFELAYDMWRDEEHTVGQCFGFSV